jgi:hypothetical protein
MNEDVHKTKDALQDMQNKLEKTTLELGKMEAKNRALSQHDHVSKINNANVSFWFSME